MKHLTLTLLLLFATVFTLNSQSNAEELDLIQSIFGMEKKAMIADFITPDEATKSVFWELYDEYEVARKEFGKKRVALLDDYARNYGAMSEEKMDETISNVIAQRNAVNKLIDKYYKKIKKSVGVKEAAQFYQFENYILSGVRLYIMENIPFFGEYDYN